MPVLIAVVPATTIYSHLTRQFWQSEEDQFLLDIESRGPNSPPQKFRLNVNDNVNSMTMS